MRIRTLGLAIFLAGIACSSASLADEFPSKPVEIINPFPPGGVSDMLVRAIAPKLQAEFKQPVTVFNRPGAGGNTGTAAFIKLPPDGYAMLEAPVNTLSTSEAMYGASLPFDPDKDLVPVAPLAMVPLFLVVGPSVPVNTFPEFIAYIKQHPGLQYASGGIGHSNHLAAELLRMAAGINIENIPFNGGPQSLNSLLGGHVPWMFESGRVLTYAKSGKVKILAVSTAKRLPAYPEIPAIAETYPGFEASGWHGIVAPRGTPKAIVDRWNRAIAHAINEPDVQKLLADNQLLPFIASPQEFGDFVHAETRKWSAVIRSAGIKPE